MPRAPSPVRTQPLLWPEAEAELARADLQELASRRSNGGRRNGRRIAFGWYGGKFSHLDWLLPFLLPCHPYQEPFRRTLKPRADTVDTPNEVRRRDASFIPLCLAHVKSLVGTIGAILPACHSTSMRHCTRHASFHTSFSSQRRWVR